MAPVRLVDRWTINVYRGWPFSNTWIFTSYIPLKNSSNSGKFDLAENSVLGFVTESSEPGSEGVISFAEASKLGSGQWGLLLNISGLSKPGKYEGVVNLNPKTNGEDKVALKVIVTDFFLWPLLTLLLGISLAFLIERWASVFRGILLIKKQLSDIKSRFETAKSVFREKTEGKTFHKYNIDEDFKKTLADISDRIKTIRRLTSAKLDSNNETYRNLQIDLNSLKEDVGDWETFADELTRLDTVVKKLQEDLKETPPLFSENETSPRIIISATKLMNPEVDLTIIEFRAVHKQILEAIEFANLWLELNKEIKKYLKLTQKLSPILSTEEQKTLLAAGKLLVKAWEILWAAQDLSKLKSRNVQADLENAENTLLQLAYYTLYSKPALPKPDAAAAVEGIFKGPKIDLNSFSPSGAFTTLTNLVQPSVKDEKRGKFYGKIINKLDSVLFILAMLLAVYSGMEMLYFGEQFGTVEHYLSALTWGLVAKATLDLISASIGGLLASGFFVRKSS
jgi:hypothetical protein